MGKNWRKFQRGSWRKSETRKDVIDEARNKGRKVHFASLMDLCPSQRIRSWSLRVALRGDIVKDDSGAYAVFTEQGSSASQMTATKSHGHYIEASQDVQGQAADTSICSYSGSKWKMHPNNSKFQKSECSDIWIRLPKHKWPQIMVQYGRPSRSPRKEFCTVIFWQDHYGERQFEKSSAGKRLEEKVPNWECWFVNREKRTLLVCVCGRLKNGWKEIKTLTQCKKSSSKALIWENRHHFLDHVYLGCIQRECQTSKDVVDQKQQYVRIQDFCWDYRETACCMETWCRNDIIFVLWHGRSKILRTWE